MIFVSFGSHNQKFDRLANAVEQLASDLDEEVIVQYGFTAFTFRHAKGFDYCTKDEMANYIEKASVLILQGGWGSISEAIDKKKRIVVVPRINGVEHIHDQKQLVVKLEKLNCVLGVYEIDDLPLIVNKARNIEFKGLERGSTTKIINDKLNVWFRN